MTDQIRDDIRNQLTVGFAAVLLLVGGLGGWAATSSLASAVLAAGSIVVESNIKKVQHPTGGVVKRLYVREGDHVKAGDVLISLDDTQTKANLAIVSKALDELTARRARYEAERDQMPAIVIPADLQERSEDAAVRQLIAEENKLFDIRRTARDGQKRQLDEQIAQLADQIAGLAEQQAAKEKEIDWDHQELDGVRKLWKQNLVQFARVTALERDAARLQGERGALIASAAQAKGRIAETKLKLLQIDEDLRSEVGKELAEIRAKSSEFAERRVAAEDQLVRTDIRAPEDGAVHQLAVHTIGGVVSSQGEPLMLLVPEADALLVEARVAPQDIDQVKAGQTAHLRFSAFNQRTTPEIISKVSMVAADVSQDGKTGASYYTIRIAIQKAEQARLNDHKLVPGMPVEVFIETGARPALSYLVKPLRDQLQRAFREK